MKNLTAKPFLLSCGARAMPKSPFGTSFVMTDPEAVIALSPTRTGATKELLLYGGPIAVRKTQAGNIRSETAYYKVTLSLKEQPNLSDQKTMGVVDIGTRSESLMQKFIKFISATLLRELSF